MPDSKAGPVAKQESHSGSQGLSSEMQSDLQQIYLQGVRADLAALDALLADLSQERRAWPEILEGLQRVTHNVKGQGSSFGYPLMTEIGGSLHNLLRQAPDRPSPAVVRVIETHVTCLQRVIAEEIDGEPGPQGQRLVERLRALTGRVISTDPTALA